MDLARLAPDRTLDAPVFMQLYQRFRDAIADGRLAPGGRVPSVRSLASQLNLARGTVAAAYEVLVSEGYLVARGPAGTVVSPGLAGHRGAVAPRGIANRSPVQTTTADPLPFELGLPALDAFPRKTWTRLAGRRGRTMGVADLAYPPSAGHEPLRRAIAAYLGISRGIACAPEQVFVTAGYGGALDLIRQTLFRAGDLGWFEDPGYPRARRLLIQTGLRLAPVPVDDDGLDVAAGKRLAATARFAVVTPTHQSPLGVALSLPRRLALLDWAQARRAWVIEDDYDSEFRYHGRPLPALKSLDRNGRVLYTGTFSKVLYPGLRLAYLVVPEDRVDAFRNAARLLQTTGSVHLQSVVTDFMEQGHFARHLRKMRALYTERRGWLAHALEQAFGDALHIPDRAGGLHLLACWAASRCDDRAFARQANAHGLAIHALRDWSVRKGQSPGMLLGFANLTTRGQAQALVQRLYRASKDA